MNIGENEPRNEVGENYPEYQSYMRTSPLSLFQSGSAMVDMRKILGLLFYGLIAYKDYNQGRGHYYAIEDLHNSLVGAPEAKR